MFHVVEGTGGLGADDLSGDDGDDDLSVGDGDDLGDDKDQGKRTPGTPLDRRRIT